MYKIALAIYSILLIFQNVASLDAIDANPHFGESIRVVRLQDNIIRSPELSPDGGFIFMNAENVSVSNKGLVHSLGVSQMVWDTRFTAPNEPITFLETRRIVDINQDQHAHGLFTTNGAEIVIRTDDSLQVRNIAKFDLLHEVANLRRPEAVNWDRTYFNAIAKRPNLNWFATLSQNEIVVWDIDADVVYKTSLLTRVQQIISRESGWLIYPEYGSTDKRPFACEFDLSKCGRVDSVNLGWMPENPPDSVVTELILRLGDSENYIAATSIAPPAFGIYQSGSSDPVDTIDLIDTFGADNINEWGTRIIRTPGLEYQTISADGRTFLYNLGYAAIIIPIEYPEE